jgi:hypothetical protein
VSVISCSFLSNDFDAASNKKKFVLQFHRLCLHYHAVFVYVQNVEVVTSEAIATILKTNIVFKILTSVFLLSI